VPLAKPRAIDMKSVLGLCHKAIRPPMGDATAAAPATVRMMRRLEDTKTPLKCLS
jgi:hypothetical protein